MEYKRKFLINNGYNIVINNARKKVIKQGYINANGDLGIRSINDKAFYLVKKSNDVKTKSEISKEEYDRMIQLFNIKIITKTRYYININNQIAKYDIYMNELDGLKIITINFEKYDDYLKYQIPDYFGMEITKMASYQPENLINSYYDIIDKKIKKKVK